jgi:mono/diheme cytochrome c family protein
MNRSYRKSGLNKSAFAVVVMVAIGGTFTIRATSMAPIAVNVCTPAALYARNCASCHGRDGGARTSKVRLNHARKLNDSEWQDRTGDERIFNSIMNGKGKRPAYGKKLSEQEIDSLVSYVRGLKR